MKSLNELNIVLIMSADDDIRKRFSRLLDRIGAAYLFEKERTRVIVRILEMDLRLIVVDLPSENGDSIDFVRLIKKLRPRLPVMVILSDPLITEADRFLEAGARYCVIKPVKEEQMVGFVEESVRNEMTDLGSYSGDLS